MKFKKIQLLRRLKLKQKLHGIDNNPLYIYLEYKLKSITTNSVKPIVSSINIMLEADIILFDIILRWL